MRTYELRIAPSAQRPLARLPKAPAAAVVELITGALLDNPRRVGKPLGLELSGYWGVRRGAYRVVYRIVETEHYVRVIRIDHRADIYRMR